MRAGEGAHLSVELKGGKEEQLGDAPFFPFFAIFSFFDRRPGFTERDARFLRSTPTFSTTEEDDRVPFIGTEGSIHMSSRLAPRGLQKRRRGDGFL